MSYPEQVHFRGEYLCDHCNNILIRVAVLKRYNGAIYKCGNCDCPYYEVCLKILDVIHKAEPIG